MAADIREYSPVKAIADAPIVEAELGARDRQVYVCRRYLREL